jgi:uncharacterized RDD family membrane protein YckC
MSAAAPIAVDTERVRFREIVTPEGVPIRFQIAGPGDRVWGFFLDALLIAAMAFGIFLLYDVLVTARLLGPWAAAVLIVVFFLLRNGYFAWFEIRWSGATPGKHVAKTRVIDRRGRPLTSRAVFVRNVTREMEIVLPITMLSAPDDMLPGAGGLQLVAVAGLGAMALLPLLNRDHLRVGDLLAGTMVVRAPAAKLYRDISATRPAEPRYRFTPEQLDIYGIYELQVLEEVLRTSGPDAIDARRTVMEKIAAKIGWPGHPDRVEPSVFLREFYAAQRARLEQRMLLGERRERKSEE